MQLCIGSSIHHPSTQSSLPPSIHHPPTSIQPTTKPTSHSMVQATHQAKLIKQRPNKATSKITSALTRHQASKQPSHQATKQPLRPPSKQSTNPPRHPASNHTSQPVNLQSTKNQSTSSRGSRDARSGAASEIASFSSCERPAHEGQRVREAAFASILSAMHGSSSQTIQKVTARSHAGVASAVTAHAANQTSSLSSASLKK